MSLVRPVTPNPYDLLPPVPSFDVISSDITHGAPLSSAQVSERGAPDGGNQSPHLAWSGFPAETKSFTVTCFDPDAPTPCGFWHWLAVDLPAATTSLDSGAGANDDALPGAAFHVRNDTGNFRYDGATPPEGDRVHRYFYVVHAVDLPRLGPDSSASAAVISFNLAFHTLARAILVGTYQR